MVSQLGREVEGVHLFKDPTVKVQLSTQNQSQKQAAGVRKHWGEKEKKKIEGRKKMKVGGGQRNPNWRN